MPVPSTMTMADEHPARLPQEASARAAALASFTMVTGTPQRASSSCTSGKSSPSSSAPVVLHKPPALSMMPGTDMAMPSTRPRNDR